MGYHPLQFKDQGHVLTKLRNDGIFLELASDSVQSFFKQPCYFVVDYTSKDRRTTAAT